MPERENEPGTHLGPTVGVADDTWIETYSTVVLEPILLAWTEATRPHPSQAQQAYVMLYENDT
jgi:hypothetical protein